MSDAFATAITATGLLPWVLSPDWSSPVVETIEHKTNVMIAWSGAEQRRALRLAPRRIFAFGLLLRDTEHRLAEAMLQNWSARTWALPIWPDGERIGTALAAGATVIPCQPLIRDYSASGLALVIDNPLHFELVPVSALAADHLSLGQPLTGSYTPQARIVPVRRAMLTGWPQLTRPNGNLVTSSITFTIAEPCDYPALTGQPSYRGGLVLEDSPDAATDGSYDRQAVTLDPGTGSWFVDDTARQGFPIVTHNFWAAGAARRAWLRSLLYTLRGMQGEVWLPSYQSDLRLAADAAAGATSIDIEATGYTTLLLGDGHRRDIRIETQAGAIGYHRITGATALDAWTERLTLDTGLIAATGPASIRRISYMPLSRLNTDSVDINHYESTHGLALAAAPFRALPAAPAPPPPTPTPTPVPTPTPTPVPTPTPTPVPTPTPTPTGDWWNSYPVIWGSVNLTAISQSETTFAASWFIPAGTTIIGAVALAGIGLGDSLILGTPTLMTHANAGIFKDTTGVINPVAETSAGYLVSAQANPANTLDSAAIVEAMLSAGINQNLGLDLSTFTVIPPSNNTWGAAKYSNPITVLTDQVISVAFAGRALWLPNSGGISTGVGLIVQNKNFIISTPWNQNTNYSKASGYSTLNITGTAGKKIRQINCYNVINPSYTSPVMPAYSLSVLVDNSVFASYTSDSVNQAGVTGSGNTAVGDFTAAGAYPAARYSGGVNTNSGNTWLYPQAYTSDYLSSIDASRVTIALTPSGGSSANTTANLILYYM